MPESAEAVKSRLWWAKMVKRRALKPAPFGRCPQWDCQDSLVVIPNKTKGADAFVGCPRQPDGRCNGYVRWITPAEYASLPKELFRIVKLKWGL